MIAQLRLPSEPTGVPSADRPAALPREFWLRDGMRVRVRPIRPEDRDRLRVGVHQLSAASRYHRFLATVSELSDEQLRYLTAIDHVNHLAWIALDPAKAGEPAVGVARCIRFRDNPSMARAAVTAADAGVWELDIPVPEDPATLAESPTGRVFKAVAARVGRGWPA